MVQLSIPQNKMSVEAGHVPGLDGLRALSVGLVLVGHFYRGDLIPGGFGVTVFFFISGFLITRLMFLELESNQKISLKNFYLRRFFRLLPVVLTYVFVIVFVYLSLGIDVAWSEIAAVLFYYVNYFVSSHDFVGFEMTMPVGIFWSLSIEEHFYFLMPFLFIFAAGRPALILKGALAVCLGCLVIRLGYCLVWPETIGTRLTYFHSETRFDSIAYGVVLASLCQIPKGQFLIRRMLNIYPFLVAAAVLLFCFLYRDDFFRDTWRYSLQGLALLVAVPMVIWSEKLKPLNWALNLSPVRWTGRLSYSTHCMFGIWGWRPCWKVI